MENDNKLKTIKCSVIHSVPFGIPERKQQKAESCDRLKNLHFCSVCLVLWNGSSIAAAATAAATPSAVRWLLLMTTIQIIMLTALVVFSFYN